MEQDFEKLIQAFDKAIKKKEKGSFGKSEIKEIFEASQEFFNKHDYVDAKYLEKLRDKFVTLAEGRIDKAGAMKKLQGTSRPEAIRSVLETMGAAKK